MARTEVREPIPLLRLGEVAAAMAVPTLTCRFGKATLPAGR